MKKKEHEQKHLPKNSQDRDQLLQQIQQQLSSIEGKPEHEKDVAILKLRSKLIEDCHELSVVRIEHLEEIFKHYCTHIFKIGKHMTFERLEYEKVHLTLDRLCVFLKDFGLTMAHFDGHQQEVLDKNEIVRYFKRLSKNCRDLSFEEFIACLEKLAIVYYDQKETYQERQNRTKEDRDKRIAEYKKKLKEKAKQKQQSQIQQSNPQAAQEQENNGEHEEEGENDDLVKGMMEDENIEDPTQEIKQALGEETNKKQGNPKQQESRLKKNRGKQPSEVASLHYETRPLYQLTIEQKVEYYYQLIRVDNVSDFRNKMSELNLPLFQQYKPKKSVSTKQSNEIHVVIEGDNAQEDKRRLIELREKLNMKKERDKNLHSPIMSKQEYEERKKKREEKQADMMRDGVGTANRIVDRQAGSKAASSNAIKRKVDPTQKEISLNMLNHLSIDDLKTKFNPTKYFSTDDSDLIFLNEYGSTPSTLKESKAGPKAKPSRSNFKEKSSETMDFKKRTSSNIVDDFKKRAYEMKLKEMHQEGDMSRFANRAKLSRQKMQPL